MASSTRFAPRAGNNLVVLILYNWIILESRAYIISNNVGPIVQPNINLFSWRLCQYEVGRY